MFKSLRIARFRGIKEGEVPDLRQVSLFVGPNNSGKSTILDALLLANSIYAHNDPLGRRPHEVLAERHHLPSYDRLSRSRALWYAYDRTSEVEFDFAFANESALDYRLDEACGATLTLRVPCGSKPAVVAVEDLGEAAPGQVYENVKRTRPVASASLAPAAAGTREAYGAVRSFLHDLILIDSGFTRDTRVEQRLWPLLISDRRDKMLTHMLREVYGMDVESLTYTLSENGYELVVMLPKYSVRVDDLGDGARYFVRMLMVLSMLRDTTLLLEEPETAHHCRALADITRWIVRSAKERNLQVLATTHSLETVDHFLAACTESSVEFGLHHTELKDGVLTCRSVDRNDARVLMDMGVDPRCAP